jgi:hypothetical protein
VLCEDIKGGEVTARVLSFSMDSAPPPLFIFENTSHSELYIKTFFKQT